jgi:hypothetical protein
MTMADLAKFKDQHGRIVYVNKLGELNTLYGYIREVNCDSLTWEDNELPYKCKIKNVIDFKVMKLPEWKQ